jgi:hypothetical protein
MPRKPRKNAEPVGADRDWTPEELAILGHAVNERAEARRLDRLPDPECVTVDESINILRVHAAVMPQIGLDAKVFDQYQRRDWLIGASPGFRALKRWVECNGIPGLLIDAAQEFRRQLCKRLSKDHEEVAGIPLLDAVLMLENGGASVEAPESKPINKNEARDKFIYERRKAGLENKLIRKSVNETPGWPKLGTDQAVNGVVDRYCKRNNLDKPRYKTTNIKRH